MCSFIKPSASVEALIKAIVSGINIQEEPLMWRNVHTFMPVVFEVFENVGISDYMRLLLGELWNIAVLPFIHANEDTEKSTVTTHPDDELSFFPSLPKYRNRGQFEKDELRLKKGKLPQKLFWTSKSSSRGIHSLLSS